MFDHEVFGTDHGNLRDAPDRSVTCSVGIHIDARPATRCHPRYLPFTEMRSLDEATADTQDFVFASPGEVYVVYVPNGQEVRIDLAGDRRYDVA